MKKFALVLIGALLLPSGVSAQVRVKGYVKKDGTYVAPHYRSSPNGTKLDNYSTKGNVNPYTGQAGTRDVFSNPYNNTSGYGSLPSYDRATDSSSDIWDSDPE